MTKRLFTVLVAALALLALAASFWVTRQVVVSCSPMKSLNSLGQVEHLRRELSLEGRQVEAIRQLENELAGTLSDRCSRYCAARAALGNALIAGTNTEAETQALIGELCALQTGSETATYEHIRKVSEILTPDQKKRFIGDLMRCRCASGCCSRER